MFYSFFLQVIKYVFYSIATVCAVVLFVSLGLCAVAPVMLYIIVDAFPKKEKKPVKKLSWIEQAKKAYQETTGNDR